MKDRAQPAVPAYQQVANLLRAQMVVKTSPQPELLPSERELAEQYHVARGTIRSALAMLEAEGLVRRKIGWATVTDPEGIAAWNRMRPTRRILAIAGKWPLTLRPEGYIGQLYQGVLTTGQEAGYSCGMRQLPMQHPKPGVEIVPEDPEQVLGVVLIGILNEQAIAMHAEAGYPVVCIDHWPVHPLVDAVMVDCFAEAHQAVDFLVSQGHRELFYVGNELGQGPYRRPETDAVQMEAGYRRATQLAGLESSANRVLYCKPDDPTLRETIGTLMRQRPRPTAGVIFSPSTMFRILDVLRTMALRCPEDVSLITKSPKTEPIDGASLETDGFRVGRSAVEILLARAAGKQPAGQRLLLASTLHRGPTVAVAPSQRVAGNGPCRDVIPSN